MATRKIAPHPPAPSFRETLHRQAEVRYEFICTILLDAVVILAAMMARAAILWVARFLPDAVRADNSIHWLALLADWGLVGAAGAFTFFDFGKRVLRELVDFLNVWHNRRPGNATATTKIPKP
jgi:hypothetical protein